MLLMEIKGSTVTIGCVELFSGSALNLNCDLAANLVMLPYVTIFPISEMKGIGSAPGFPPQVG